MIQIPAHSTLLFIGDSITDCGRKTPVGEGLFDALGKGYVALFDAQLGAMYPEHPIRIINMGTSGNTVRELRARWEADVIAHSPDWLSIMIGINDVWRQFDLPRMTPIQISLEEYRETLAALIAEAVPGLKGLIVASPYFIEVNRDDAMRRRMEEYAAIAKALAQKHQAIFVDTQAAFDRVLAHVHPAALAWDRIHPTLTGHMILANAFLAAVGAP